MALPGCETAPETPFDTPLPETPLDTPPPDEADSVPFA